eukprot:COSAG02_NODE_2464_length_8789_cov_10.474502_1_plen_116_part_00
MSSADRGEIFPRCPTGRRSRATSSQLHTNFGRNFPYSRNHLHAVSRGAASGPCDSGRFFRGVRPALVQASPSFWSRQVHAPGPRFWYAHGVETPQKARRHRPVSAKPLGQFCMSK